MGPEKKLEILKGSFESGIISKEEYEKFNEKLEPDVKEFDEKIKELRKEDVQEEPKKSSNASEGDERARGELSHVTRSQSTEKILIISIAAIALLFVAILAFSILNKQQPKTLEDLHVLNLQGKLKPEQGYVYKGAYSWFLRNIRPLDSPTPVKGSLGVFEVNLSFGSTKK